MMRVSALVAVSAVVADANLAEDFEKFKRAFRPAGYDSPEEELRHLRIFLQNAARAELLNMESEATSFSVMSPFADVDPEEFKKRNGLQYAKWDQKDHKLRRLPDMPTDDLPDEFDWRDHGAVNAVKDQGQCGSCWAFGTIANIEGASVAQGQMPLLALSEQEVVDCSKQDNGCNGGLPSYAYEDLIKGSIGLELMSDYPYHSGTDGKAGKCADDKSLEKVFIHKWVSVSEDEAQIQAALYKYGPLAIGLNAGPLQMYFGGVLDPFSCDPAGIDHAVTLIGWGEEAPMLPWSKKKAFWWVRNSWGSSWGLSGYFKIARGKGTCGLNKMVTSVIMTEQEQDPLLIA